MKKNYQRKERKSNHKCEVVRGQKLLVRVPLPMAEVWAEMQTQVADRARRTADPTSFSPWPGHCCRMKRLFTTRNFCVRRHAQSLCAWPFFQPCLSTFASHLFARILHLRHSLLSLRWLLCSLTTFPAQLGTEPSHN